MLKYPTGTTKDFWPGVQILDYSNGRNQPPILRKISRVGGKGWLWSQIPFQTGFGELGTKAENAVAVDTNYVDWAPGDEITPVKKIPAGAAHSVDMNVGEYFYVTLAGCVAGARYLNLLGHKTTYPADLFVRIAKRNTYAIYGSATDSPYNSIPPKGKYAQSIFNARKTPSGKESLQKCFDGHIEDLPRDIRSMWDFEIDWYSLLYTAYPRKGVSEILPEKITATMIKNLMDLVLKFSDTVPYRAALNQKKWEGLLDLLKTRPPTLEEATGEFAWDKFKKAVREKVNAPEKEVSGPNPMPNDFLCNMMSWQRTGVNESYKRNVRALGLPPGWKFCIDFTKGRYIAKSPKGTPPVVRFHTRTQDEMVQLLKPFANKQPQQLELSMNQNQKYAIVGSKGSLTFMGTAADEETALTAASEKVASGTYHSAVVYKAVKEVKPKQNVEINPVED